MCTLFEKVPACDGLLRDFPYKERRGAGEKLIFEGVCGRDVYNITVPFEDDGDIILAGRVEERGEEDSKIVFFSCKDNVWHPRRDLRTFRMQDPFYKKVHGLLTFGGVETFPRQGAPGLLDWRTVFYKGRNVKDLKQFAVGPDGMKDIRLMELKDSRIGVFTRPQGAVGGRGKIGFTIIDSLEDLTIESILKADLITGQFARSEWGGANELHLLNNGLIGVLGHIACYDRQHNRHYYAMVFSFDPDSRKASSIRIIAARENFKEGVAKRPDLKDVIFSGGLVRLGGGKAVLYAGVSDAEAHRIILPDPFDVYET